MHPSIPAILLCISLAASAASVLAQQPAVRGAEDPLNPCGLIYTNHFGPLDYRKQRATVKTVEDFHYTPSVQAAIGGATGTFGGDINYTLKAVPNHPKALISLMRWVERTKRDQTQGMEWPIECYFERAVRFRPDDNVVRGLYAKFLIDRKRKEDALKQLDIAVTHAGDNAFSHYSLGLLYLELGEYVKALRQAHTVQAMNFPRTELVDALKKANQWSEPQPDAASTRPIPSVDLAAPVAASQPAR